MQLTKSRLILAACGVQLDNGMDPPPACFQVTTKQRATNEQHEGRECEARRQGVKKLRI